MFPTNHWWLEPCELLSLACEVHIASWCCVCACCLLDLEISIWIDKSCFFWVLPDGIEMLVTLFLLLGSGPWHKLVVLILKIGDGYSLQLVIVVLTLVSGEGSF